MGKDISLSFDEDEMSDDNNQMMELQMQINAHKNRQKN
jgi:hypothetical protein